MGARLDVCEGLTATVVPSLLVVPDEKATANLTEQVGVRRESWAGAEALLGCCGLDLERGDATQNKNSFGHTKI